MESYRTGIEPVTDVPPAGRDARFWLSPEDRGDGRPRYQIVDSFVDSVRPWFDTRRERNVEYLKYYGVSYDNYGQTSSETFQDTLKFNVCEPIVDAAVNKICKSRIVPMAITVGGTYPERQQAKKFNRFISGLFQECGIFDLDYQITTEAFVGDAGVLKVIEDDERVKVERVDSHHLYWDPEEAKLTNNVTVIVEDHFIDRYRLVELLKELDDRGKLVCDLNEAIQAVMSADFDTSDSRYFSRPNQHDVVMIREAWHTKSSRRAKDGCHVICLKGKLDLVAECYNFTEIPHLFSTRKHPLYGLTSPGVMSNVLAGQKEHDDVTERIRIGQRDVGVPRVVIRKGGSVTPSQLNNIPGSVVEADNPREDVVFHNAQPIHPDVYMYRKDLVTELQLTSGVPDMALSGTPPEGVTANSALATLDDIVAEKLSQALRVREKVFVKLSERCLERVAEIAKRHRGKYVVYNDEGKMLEALNYKDVAIPFGSYRLKCFPTNFLSQTPSVRYQRLAEMQEKGQISELEWRTLTEIPDLEKETDLATAPQDVVDKCIDAILSKGRTIVAESFDDHALILRRGMSAYNLARVEGPDPEEDPEAHRKHETRLRALSNYIQSAANWMKPPPVTPNSAGVGAPPPGPMDTGMAGMVPPPIMPQPPPGMGGGPPGMNPYGNPAEMLSNGA